MAVASAKKKKKLPLSTQTEMLFILMGRNRKAM